MLSPKCGCTFSDYKHNSFLPYLQSILNKVQRIDVVFDVYYPDSVKTHERSGAVVHEQR